jgi:ketosteroid isomerase-like protein
VSSSEASENLALARRYLFAIVSGGATGSDLAQFFTEDVVQEEFPNRLLPTGARRDRAAILEGAVRGQKVISAQHFDIQREMASGDRVALEVIWTGTLAISMGSIPVGGTMRARFAVFLDFDGGKISAQRIYDCFDPFSAGPEGRVPQ